MLKQTNHLMKIIVGVLLIVFSLSNTSVSQDLTNEPEAKLTKEQIADFKGQAERIIKTLGDYVKIIGDKSQETARRKSSINQAVKLFLSDTNVVQVSSLTTKKITEYTIGKYLNRLMMLRYDKVNITWYDMYMSDEFKLRSDGKYEAIATVFQKFDGVTNNEFENRRYTDVTQKNIQIIIEKLDVPVGDKVEVKWRIFLGDITVVDTKL